jgi:hypothetical protein
VPWGDPLPCRSLGESRRATPTCGATSPSDRASRAPRRGRDS